MIRDGRDVFAVSCVLDKLPSFSVVDFGRGSFVFFKAASKGEAIFLGSFADFVSVVCVYAFCGAVYDNGAA
jgi:hypothetical protein